MSSNTVKDIPPNTTYSKFSASLAASHAQAIASSTGNTREADRELSRNDVAFRKVALKYIFLKESENATFFIQCYLK